MVSPKIQENKMVILEGERIKEIQDENEFAKFQSYQTTNLQGHYLLPGLIDNHVHLTNPFIEKVGLLKFPSILRQMKRNLKNCIESGVTTVRDMGAVPKPIQGLREKVKQGKIPGPRILCCNSMITCPDGYPDFVPYFTGLKKSILGGQFAERVLTPEEVRNTVQRMVALGADWIKTLHDARSVFVGGRDELPTLPDECYEALIDEAHTLGKKVAMHQIFLTGFHKGLQFSVDTLEHVPIDKELTDSDISTFIDKKMVIIPTLKPPGDFLIMDEIQKILEQEGNHYLEKAAYKNVSSKLNMFVNNHVTIEYYIDYEYLQRQYPQALANVTKLYKAGAIIGFGTDSGGTDFGFFGFPYKELEHLVKAGMSNFEALQTATNINAEILGLQALGTIEPGKVADLVLIEGNPLDDVSNVKNVKIVWKEGQLVFNDS